MICRRCKDDKPTDEFRKDKRAKSGFKCYCIICEDLYSKEYYERNREKVIENSKLSNIKIREKLRQYIIEYLRDNPCVDCGENDIVVLEFDHKENKKYNITELIRNTSFNKLKEEINKCEVRCANCHRRKTAKDFNWYKLTY